MSKFMYITCMGFIIGLFALYKPVFAQDSIKISNFTLENAQGQTLSLDSLAGKKLTVVIFTSSHCSYAVQYKDRLISIYEKYRGKEVNFIAINSNDPSMSARDSASRMQAISGFPFPYLKDADQRVAKMFHATKTPEVVVLAPREKNYNIVYRGMIDDNPLDVTLVKDPYLSNAIDSLLLNKKPLSLQTALTGCNIKWIE